MSSYHIEKTEKEGILFLKISGRLDYETASDFNQHVNDEIHKTTKTIVFDFQDLDFISSAGLGALINISREFQKSDGKITITAMNPNIEKIFNLRGFDTFFSIETGN